MEGIKRCGRCKKEKAVDEFDEGKKLCKSCLVKCAEYQKNNPEKMNAKCKRYYDRKKEDILAKKKEKVWCEACRTEIVKSGWDDHVSTYKHQYYLSLEPGEVIEDKHKWWCDVCRVSLFKKSKSDHKKSKRHQALEKAEPYNEEA